MVEVLELDGLECALAQAVVEEQTEGYPIAEALRLGNDCPSLVVVERGPVDLARRRAFDRQGRVPVELAAKDLELEEVLEDREVLVVVAGAAFSVLVLEELLEPLSADRWLEVLDLEIEEVADQLV